MNRIEELIQELCPEGVEFMPIKKLFIVTIGEFVHKSKHTENGKYPVYNGGIVPTGLYEEFNNTGPKIIISARGANAGYVNKIKTKYWAGNSCYSLAVINLSIINYVFGYYYLKANQSKLIEQQQKGSIPAVSKKQIEEFLIPIPPLPIQQEIVNILDKFTQLEDELNAELELRRTQYEFYLNQLMEFEGKEVEWVEIGKIGQCFAGATPKTIIKEYWENGTIPWMSSGEVNYGNIYETEKKITQMGFNNSSTKMIPANSVVIALAGQGRTRGTVAITRIPLCTNQSLCSVVTGERVKSEFLYYFLKTQYSQLRNVSSGDGTRGGLNLQMIRDYKIPIPPLSEQERIVSILDKFEALVNDSSIGLQAEIEARRKQFEYYRNKLLTFAEYE